MNFYISKSYIILFLILLISNCTNIYNKKYTKLKGKTKSKDTNELKLILNINNPKQKKFVDTYWNISPIYDIVEDDNISELKQIIKNENKYEECELSKALNWYDTEQNNCLLRAYKKKKFEIVDILLNFETLKLDTTNKLNEDILSLALLDYDNLELFKKIVTKIKDNREGYIFRSRKYTICDKRNGRNHNVSLAHFMTYQLVSPEKMKLVITHILSINDLKEIYYYKAYNINESINPLQMAFSNISTDKINYNYEIVKLLIEYGVDPQCQNTSSKSSALLLCVYKPLRFILNNLPTKYPLKTIEYLIYHDKVSILHKDVSSYNFIERMNRLIKYENKNSIELIELKKSYDNLLLKDNFLKKMDKKCKDQLERKETLRVLYSMLLLAVTITIAVAIEFYK